MGVGRTTNDESSCCVPRDGPAYVTRRVCAATLQNINPMRPGKIVMTSCQSAGLCLRDVRIYRILYRGQICADIDFQGHVGQLCCRPTMPGRIDAVIRRSVCHHEVQVDVGVTSLTMARNPACLSPRHATAAHQPGLRAMVISELSRAAEKATLAAAFAPKQSQSCGSAHQREARHGTMHLSC